MVYIYGIFNDAANELVYVGRTRDPLLRLQSHKRSTGKTFKSGCRMEILQEGKGLGASEEFFWIEYARFLGANLVNKQVRFTEPSTKNGVNVAVFNKCLAACRNGKGISLEELAAKASLSFTTVYKMSRGTSCNRNSLKKVAEVLRVQPNYLVNKKEAT